ncbi:MAG: hypothetical protein Q8P41_20300 [Pseudomonadota bacterium]|nr:hypothetical protein [Pseudomonadota bacterium]
MNAAIEDWRQRAEQAALLGNMEQEIAARQELATRSMAAGDGAGARAALDRTLVLARQLGDIDEEGRTLYALALLQQRIAPQGGAARRLLEEAEQAARKGGDLPFLARVLDKRAGLMIAEGKPLQAAKLLNDVAALHGTCGDEDARLDVLRRLAMTLQMAGKPSEAFDILLDALAESKASPAQLVRARLELHLLARGTGIEGESLQQLLDEAVADGDVGAAGYIRLQMAADALQGGDPVGGEAHADAARRDALDCLDAILYLNACLMIAEAREARGDRVGMLTILFTCKASLQDLLGEQGARPVLALIHSLEQRWGPEDFGAALEQYRAQFR